MEPDDLIIELALTDPDKFCVLMGDDILTYQLYIEGVKFSNTQLPYEFLRFGKLIFDFKSFFLFISVCCIYFH